VRIDAQRLRSQLPTTPLRATFVCADDAAHAAEINKQTLKLAAKCVVLWTEGAIVPAAVAHLQEPFVATAVRVCSACERRNTESDGDLESLPAELERCVRDALPVLRGHIKVCERKRSPFVRCLFATILTIKRPSGLQEKSCDQLLALAGYYTSPTFVRFFLWAPESVDARARECYVDIF
jgi:hypothetical protein